MKYYDSSKGALPFSQLMANSRADESDIKRLLWIGRIDFY